MSFITELKRRNVHRMAVLYVLAAWLVMQVADVLSSLVTFPDWLGPTLLAMLAIGFPIALVFSWFFEVTPAGLSLEKDVPEGQSITRATGRRMDFVIIAILSAGLILFAYDKWWPRRPQELSIAVLPFTNSSDGDESADFLATGIQDDLLTKLSKIGALKVISRTSVERYRNGTRNIQTIGAELGVGKILEGGVQREGDNFRVNVQLIDTATDEHIWAETYDRSLTATNVFKVQSEIVETIAQQLNTKIKPQETRQLTQIPTRSLTAYTAYLRGIQQSDTESITSLNQAIESFKEAINLDQGFELAYVGLADVYLTLGHFYDAGGLSIDESVVLAEPPLAKALELNGEIGQAYSTLGLLRQMQGNFQAAEEAYNRAIYLQPNYSRVFGLYGTLRMQQGRLEEAGELYEKALDLDPLSAPVNFQIARFYDLSGQFQEALERYHRVIEIEPDHAFAYVHIAAIHYLVLGQLDESLIWYRKAAENDALSPSLQAAQAIAYLELGDPDSAKEWVRKGLDLGANTFWSVWSSLLLDVYLGDDQKAQIDSRTLLEIYPRNWGGLRVLRDADIAAGRDEVARSRYARAFPELVEPEAPEVTEENYRVAVDLALVLIRLGEQEQAYDLLEGSLRVIETQPRLGATGFWITDVRIFSLQQRRREALDALKRAIDEGWRFLSWYFLELDPNLDFIRDEPEFQRLYSELKSDLETQAMRVRDLKASGEL